MIIHGTQGKIRICGHEVGQILDWSIDAPAPTCRWRLTGSPEQLVAFARYYQTIVAFARFADQTIADADRCLTDDAYLQMVSRAIDMALCWHWIRPGSRRARQATRIRVAGLRLLAQRKKVNHDQ